MIVGVAMGERKEREEPPKKIIDRHRTTTNKKGLAGLLESFIRRFKTLSFLFLLGPVIALVLGAIGLSLFPSMLLFNFVKDISSDYHTVLQSLILAVTVGVGYFIYGSTLIFVVPIINFILPKTKPWRGNWHSNQTIPWYIHNALTYVVRYSFLDFITPTPLNILFYRMMGMKIGKGVIINTTNISDPGLITLEDYVTIGGSATIMAHYGQKGYLILAPVVIRKGANIGLKSSIMGDVEIGEGATVKPHSVILPKTRVPKNAVV